jgi:hypothetical protein
MSSEAMRAVEITDLFGNFWCRLMHDSPMWPIHGQYRCRTCKRQFPVPWEESVRSAAVSLGSQLIVAPVTHNQG